MKVLITADPYIPVPPVHYGGIERVIDVLVRELVSRGHDVTLVAHPESRTSARLMPYGEPPHIGHRIRAKELVQVGSAVWHERRDVDVVHSFGRLAALLPILPRRQQPDAMRRRRAVGRKVRADHEDAAHQANARAALAEPARSMSSR